MNPQENKEQNNNNADPFYNPYQDPTHLQEQIYALHEELAQYRGMQAQEQFPMLDPYWTKSPGCPPSLAFA